MAVRKLSPVAQAAMDAFTRNAIETAVAATNGNLAARRCNMPRSTFYAHATRLGINAKTVARG